MMNMILLGTISLLLTSSWINMFLMLLIISLICMLNLHHFFSYSVYYLFSLSSINSLLIFLSSVLCLLVYISTPDNKKIFFTFSIVSLLVILFLVFSINNVLYFYIMFEASLVPTLMLVSYWGYQPERLQAGTYMMMYTVCASLPLLIVLLFHCMTNSSMMMIFSMFINSNYMLVFLVYMAFLVKLPMYSMHLWLPKAHVEASLAGSMLLAGVLLKLGGYGLMQMNLLFNISGSKSMPLLIIISLSFWGGLLASIMCMKQVDMKSFVAYSSVGHMSLVILGILSDSSWGYFSSVITMFAHGFSSSALFSLTYFSYTKIFSRSLFYINGVLNFYPKLSMMWFLFCCINMAVPPSLNLLGELFIVPVLYSLSLVFLLVMGLMIFISGLYNMYLYTMINHGSSSIYMLPSEPMKSYQLMSLFSHFLPLLFLMKLEVLFLTVICFKI